MAGFIQNIIWSSVEGFVDAGKRSAGEYAGNALIRAGDAIENSGRGVGNSIERKATGYGSSISGQTYQTASTARGAVVERAKSVPARGKVGAGGGKSVPMGANKYPKKAMGNSTTAAKSSAGSGVGTTLKHTSAPSLKSPARSAALPRPYPGEKKSVLRHGLPKPFTPPVEQKKTAYPGQGSRTPVQNQKPRYKPLPRLGAQVGKGETVSHLGV